MSAPATWTDPKTGIEVREGDTWQDAKPIYVGYPLRKIVVLAVYETDWVQIKTLAYQFAAGGWIKEHAARRRPQSIIKRFTLVSRAPDADPNALKPCPFCGGTSVNEVSAPLEAFEYCAACGAEGPRATTGAVDRLAEARRRWNTRAALPVDAKAGTQGGEAGR